MMNRFRRIRLVAETADTVTLRRKDFDALIQLAEDRIDLAAVEAHRAYEKEVGWDVARQNYFSRQQADKLFSSYSVRRRKQF